MQQAPAGYPTAPRAALPASLRVWVPFTFLLLYTLTFPNLKIPIGFDLRLGQVVLMMGTFALFLRDAYLQQMRWNILLSLVGMGVLLAGISILSTFPKIKEAVFIIKYTMVYPSAFYLGARLLFLIPLRRFLQVLELTLVLACVGGIVLEFVPIVPLIHPRPGYLEGLKGSFWEQGEMAFVLGLFMLTSLALRMANRLWPARRIGLIAVYLLALGCMVATYNKTVWLALGGALLVGAVIFTDRRRGGRRRKRRWAPHVVLAVLVFGIGLTLYNSSLAPGQKIVTAQALENKWENERGAALRISWDLIQENPVFGKGFGFVEAYFGSHSVYVIGLGEGVAQIFNSYLDIWLSTGLFGLAYALGLLAFAFNRRSLLAVFVVTYLFVFANFNPYAQSEYYYLFLGLCWATREWGPHVDRPDVPLPRPC